MMLKQELEAGILCKVDSPLTCVHGIFVVPKDGEGGGGRSVIDCSKTAGHSVNNFTSTVAPSFKYKGLDDIINVLETGNMFACIDIKD